MSVFSTNWKVFIKNYMPWWWRTKNDGSENTYLAFCRGFFRNDTGSDGGIQHIADELSDYRDEVTALLNYTGQHKALVEYLNDNYDDTLRRIDITENDVNFDNLFIDLYQQGEADFRPDSLYEQSETLPWDAGTTYSLGDYIEYDGTMYKSLAGSNLNKQPDLYLGVWWDAELDPDGNTVTSIDFYEAGEEVSIINFTIEAPSAAFPAGWTESTVTSQLKQYVEATKKWDYSYV